MPIGAIVENIGVRANAVNAIAHASQRSGVSFDYLLAQARLESSLDPNAKASTSSASGLFQFTRQSWLATLARHGAANGYSWAADAIKPNGKGGYSVADPAMRNRLLDLRFDPHASSLMAAAFADDNAATLREQFGTEPEPVDLYLAHFLGAAGATRFLSAWRADPDAAAAPLFPKAAAANRDIFYGNGGRARSLSEIHDRFRAKMADAGAGATLDAQQFGAPIAQLAVAPQQEGAPLRSRHFRNQAMLGLEQMPGRLSLAFAEKAYARLAAMEQHR